MGTKKYGNSASKRFVPLVLILTVLLTACGDTPTSNSETSMSAPPASSDNSSSALNPNVHNPDVSEKIEVSEDALAKYSLLLAVYFQEPIDSSSELSNHPNLFDYIIHATYKIYHQNEIKLEDVTGNQDYRIPNKDLEKAAQLLLNTTLPDRIYTDKAFKYQSDTDSFVLGLGTEPPDFNTTQKSISKDKEGVYHIAITIQDMDNKEVATNVYVFKPVHDSDWGVLYQLLKIEKV